MARPSVGTLIPVGAVGTAEAGDVLTGKTFSSEPAGVGAEGSMPNRGAYNITPGTSSIAIPAGYHNGSGYVASLGGNATAGDVLSGKTFSSDSAGRNQSGSMPNQGAMVITPGTTNIAIPAGYHNGMGRVNGDANLKAENIKKGVSIFGITGNYVGIPAVYILGEEAWTIVQGPQAGTVATLTKAATYLYCKSKRESNGISAKALWRSQSKINLSPYSTLHIIWRNNINTRGGRTLFVDSNYTIDYWESEANIVVNISSTIDTGIIIETLDIGGVVGDKYIVCGSTVGYPAGGTSEVEIYGMVLK